MDPSADRTIVRSLWAEAWNKGLGFAPWKDVLAGISVAEAAWIPGDGRHSIWAHVSHICFWREFIVSAARKGTLPTDEEIHRRNFEAPTSGLAGSEAAWTTLRQRFADSHAAIGAVYADPNAFHDWMFGLIGHDSYHVGQIMLLRALQGMKPLM
jgi:hypothetical protein